MIRYDQGGDIVSPPYSHATTRVRVVERRVRGQSCHGRAVLTASVHSCRRSHGSRADRFVQAGKAYRNAIAIAVNIRVAMTRRSRDPAPRMVSRARSSSAISGVLPVISLQEHSDDEVVDYGYRAVPQHPKIGAPTLCSIGCP